MADVIPPEGAERRPTLAVIDDHTLVADGIAAALSGDGGFEVVHIGTDPGAVLDLDPPPDLVVLDIDLGTAEVTPEQAAAILDRGSRVLVVSALARPRAVIALLEAGVGGFASKRDGTVDLRAAARAVNAGEYWTTPELAGVLAADVAPTAPALSPQERRTLALYAGGLKLDSVARQLGVKPATAAEYLKRVRAKYAMVDRPARSRTELYQQAVRDRILPPPEGGETLR